MKRPPPPLRFLVLVAGGWLCMRTAVYAPGWWVGEGVAGQPLRRPAAAAGAAAAEGAAAAHGLRVAGAAGFARAPVRLRAARPQEGLQPSAPGPARTPAEASPSNPVAARAAAALPVPQMLEGAEGGLAPPASRLPSARGAAESAPRPGRWSGSAWLLLRREAKPALAQGGTLGGSQAGLRIAYRLNRRPDRPLSFAARLSGPAEDRRAAEVALGVEWRPLARLPVSLAAERRQALGPRGRSAFSIGAHGGVDGERLAGRLRLDAYAQAGVVGARARDLYVDGAARIVVPAGRLQLGAALSGGAQPGAAHLDAGPIVSLRLPQARLRVSAEWRFRIASDARPESGAVFTIGTDF